MWNDFLTNEEKEINSYALFSRAIKSKLIETDEELKHFWNLKFKLNSENIFCVFINKLI